MFFIISWQKNVMLASAPTDEANMPSNSAGSSAVSGSNLPYGPGMSPQPGDERLLNFLN